jgi:hypothetical protein
MPPTARGAGGDGADASAHWTILKARRADFGWPCEDAFVIESADEVRASANAR